MDYKKIVAFVFLMLCFAFSPAFGILCHADDIDSEFGGFESDALVDAVVVGLGDPDASGNYTQNVNLSVEVPYHFSRDGVSPLSVNASTVIKIMSVPAGSTVSGTLNIVFYGTYESEYVTPGYVYDYYITPPSMPTVSVSSPVHFTSELSPSCRSTGSGGGMVLYDNINRSSSADTAHGSIPVLGSSFNVNFVQQFSCPYSITNKSASTQDATIYVSPDYTGGTLRMSKSASLASLYSSAGVDYTSILNNIYARLNSGAFPIDSVVQWISNDLRYDTYNNGVPTIRKFISDIYQSLQSDGQTIGQRAYLSYIQLQSANLYLESLIKSINGAGGVTSVIKEQTDKQIEVAEKQIEVSKEQVETSKGIFAKITDFFDNFFSNLQDFIVHLIIPTEEQITAFFGEVNEWFSARLGFIWYPFDLMLQLVDIFASGDASQSFAVPSLSLDIMGEKFQIWGDFSVDLDAFGIFRYVRLITSFLMVSAIVKMAMAKWDEWIGGHGV